MIVLTMFQQKVAERGVEACIAQRHKNTVTRGKSRAFQTNVLSDRFLRKIVLTA